MGRGGWGHRWVWGGFKRRPRFLPGAEWYLDLQVREEGLETKSCLGGGQYPRSGAAPRPRSFHNLGKVVPRHSSPAVPVPGSCCRRKVSGNGRRHGKARRGQGAAQEARGILPEMLRGCSEAPGGCCPRCSEDAACPGCSGR